MFNMNYNYFTLWMATYPLDKVIQPLNWGQVTANIHFISPFKYIFIITN